MNARQARDLLELIADLYRLANTPEPPTQEQESNGVEARVEAR